MTPWSVEGGCITKEEVELLSRVQRLLEDFPDIKFFRDGKQFLLSCHMFTRALASVFPRLTVKDGYFQRRGVEHSWLLTSTRTFEIPDGNILDPYPVGQAGGPMLINNGRMSPWRPLYMEYPIPVVDTPDFQKNFGYVKRILKCKAQLLGFIPAAE